MLEYLLSATNVLKQMTPKLLLGVAITAGALLFLPDAGINTLGLARRLQDNREYVGAALLISIALLLAQGLVAGLVLIKHFYLKQKRRGELTKLTPEEKAYLILYIADQKNTLYFRIQDGIAIGLEAKGIIYRSSTVGDLDSGFAFNMWPWARAYLSKNRQLLEGWRFPA